MSGSPDSLGPAAKPRALSAARDSWPFSYFWIMGGLWAFCIGRAPIPAVAADVRLNIDFCTLIGHTRPHIATLPLATVRRSAVFAPGRTFGAYVRHAEAACALLGAGSEWRTPEVLAAIDGHPNAPARNIRFETIVRFDEFHVFI